MILDLIIENKPLMDAFMVRYKDFKIGTTQLVREMTEDGIKMDVKRLQRFIHYGAERKVTQKAYIWLLLRHGIDVSLDARGNDNTNEENRLKAKEFAT